MGLVGWYNYSVGLVRTDPSKDLSFSRYKVTGGLHIVNCLKSRLVQ